MQCTAEAFRNNFWELDQPSARYSVTETVLWNRGAAGWSIRNPAGTVCVGEMVWLFIPHVRGPSVSNILSGSIWALKAQATWRNWIWSLGLWRQRRRKAPQHQLLLLVYYDTRYFRYLSAYQWACVLNTDYFEWIDKYKCLKCKVSCSFSEIYSLGKLYYRHIYLKNNNYLYHQG